MNIEEKLRCLFDYQKFENNEMLSRLIEESEGRSELSDESLSFLNAAGEADLAARQDRNEA